MMAPGGEPYLALLVDDEPDLLEITSLQLRGAGCSVLTARDGREGFEAAKRTRPDIIISDVAMPRSDGIELCRRVRANDELSLTPILLASALRKDTASAVEALRAGTDDYLEAPYDPLRLVAKAERLVASSRLTKALRESESRFRLMADTAPVMIWMSDVGGGCVYFNKVWRDFTERAVDEELGEGWAEGVHPEDRRACLETYAGAFDARRDFRMEYRLRRHDGAYRWILDTGTPRETAEGAFAGYIGSCVDITERKEAEEECRRLNEELEGRVADRTARLQTLNDDLGREVAERKTAEEALRESREMFRLFMNNSPAVAFMKDAAGRYVYVNEPFERQFKVTQADGRGRRTLSCGRRRRPRSSGRTTWKSSPPAARRR